MHVMGSAPGARTIIDGREVDYFCGTGYFGLQGHPQLIRAACEAVQRYGTGSATSRSGYGNNPALLEVEERARQFFGTESSLYYVSGYLGSSILLPGLSEQYDVLLADEDSHYSVMDGASMAGKPVVRFAHLDADDLRRKIRRHLKPGQRPLLICDGIFPVTGEISPTDAYSKVLEEYAPYSICVDDAHATGVVGEMGRGTFEYLGLEGEGLYAAGTLSKALGGHGGIIAGRSELIEHLKRKSNIYHASSAVPTPAAAATAKALEILTEHPELRKRLWDNVSYAKRALRGLGFRLDETPVPILCLHLEGVDMKAVQDRLFQKGIAVLHLGPGAYSGVPGGGAVRVAIFSTHSKDQIDRLVRELGASI